LLLPRYGFQVEVLTWGLTKLESVGIEWIAYSDALSVRGEVRSGVVTLRTPVTSSERRVYFPGTFAEQPHVAVSVLGISADGSRDAHFSARAVAATKGGFTLQIATHAGATTKWAEISWIAFQNTTQMYGGSVALDADNDADFKHFYYPPLGKRSLERPIAFGPQTDLDCDEKVKRLEKAMTGGGDGGGGGDVLVQVQAGESAADATTSADSTTASVHVRGALAATNAAPLVTPALHPHGSTLPVHVPKSAPGSYVAFVRSSDKGCFEANLYGVKVDANHLAVPPSGLTLGPHRLCTAGVRAGPYIVANPLASAPADMTVVRSVIESFTSDLIPIPPGISSVIRLTGPFPRGCMAALVPVATVPAGCTGAAKSAGAVSPTGALSVSVGSGSYRLCVALPGAPAGDVGFAEQWLEPDTAAGGADAGAGAGAGSGSGSGTGSGSSSTAGKPLLVSVGSGAGDKGDAKLRALRNANTLEAQVMADEPLAFWPLDDLKNSPHGREIARAVTHEASIVGTGVAFGGPGIAAGFKTSASVSGGASLEARGAVPEATGPFAVEAWVSVAVGADDDGTALRSVVRRRAGGDSGAGYELGLLKHHAVCIAAGATAGTETRASSLAPLKPGSTYHVVCSHDGRRLAVYVNGLEAGATEGSAVPSAAGSRAPTVIGGAGFTGSIAAVAVYGAALPAVRVYAHFRKGFLDDGSMPRCAGRVVRPPHFTDSPAVRVELASFNFLRGSAANVRAMAARADANGFTLSLTTWGNARLHDVEVSWIAHSQPPVPPRAAVRSAAGANRNAPNSRENPHRSCRDILIRKLDRGDGSYFIRTVEGRVVRVLCDMDSGGYTRVVGISSYSAFHGGNTRASNVGELASEGEPAKLSDAGINAINTVGHFWFKCGPKYQAYVRNVNNLWTSSFGNKQRWSTSRALSTDFACAANQPTNVFGEGLNVDDPVCKKGYAMYAGAKDKGCYVDGEGWQSGSLWAR
jgi:hypothetical protein